jgi:hypothetical protein
MIKKKNNMIDFKSLGYEDITKDKPIQFLECFDEFFNYSYPYTKRFYKQEGNITIELKVGNCHSTYFIAGICYHPKGWEKFEVGGPEKHINEMFIQTLNAAKNKIKEALSIEVLNRFNKQKEE